MKNIHSIVTEISLLSNQQSVIGISETWAVTDSDHLSIPGYTCFSKARKNRGGGGVTLYLQDKLTLKTKLRPDLSIDDLSNSLFIQLTNSKSKNIIIGVIYKPPDIDVDKFTDNLESVLKTLVKERRPSYLMGGL